MKKLSLLIAFVFTFALAGFAAEKTDKLYHVVSVKFKEGTSAKDIKKVEDAFRALKTKIPGVDSLEWGTNVSSEKHDKGFTHCFILTFKSEKDRNTYLPHPEHKAFGKILGPVMEDVMVIDFWAKE